MTALVQNLADFIKVVLQSLNLSTIFPAFAFMVLLRVFVIPLIPIEYLPLPYRQADTFVRTLFELMTLGFVAYLLDAANLSIIRLLEGYPLRHYPPFRNWQNDNAQFVKESYAFIHALEEAIVGLDKKIKRTKKDSPQLAELYRLKQEAQNKRRALLRQVSQRYPEDPSLVLPFEFGNIIAAAEYYPKKTFGMHAVVLWPFLSPILTKKDYAQFFLRERSVMDFLVNLSVTLLLFDFLLFFVEATWVGIGMSLLIKVILVLLACLFLLWLSRQAAANWGLVIQTAFVLFRHDLHDSLGLRRPKDFGSEQEQWKAVSNFLRADNSNDRQKQLGEAVFNPAMYRRSNTKVED
jgi:hypothetical protein